MNETSQKQLEANRENAKKGGVKTEEGKMVSKYNALKHGLLCKEIFLGDENEDDLISLGKKMRSDFLPETEFEMILVDRMTANIWRLKRAMQMERDMMDKSRDGLFHSGKPQALGHTLTHYDIAHNDIYGKFIRYESSLERGLYKALHELQRLQSARRGEVIPPPAVVDIDVSGGNSNGFVS